MLENLMIKKYLSEADDSSIRSNLFNLILQNRWSNFIIAKHVYFKDNLQGIPLIFIGTLFSQFPKRQLLPFILEIFSVKTKFLRSTFDQNFDISICPIQWSVYVKGILSEQSAITQ